jgi:hypothetical protein
MPKLRLLAIALLACSALSNGAAQMADERAKTRPDVPAQYAATAFGESPSVAGTKFDLKVYVQKLTSDGDIEELASTLNHKGEDGLVSALDKIKYKYKGRVAPNGSVGTGMPVVRIRPTKDGGQHIVLATLNPFSPSTLFNQQCSPKDNISIVELDVDKDGKGTGSFAPICQVRFNEKNELEIDHYCLKLFRLANVYRQK